MADRYFVETPITADAARLVGPEAHHLAHVMRASQGDEVVLFDGSGAEYQARIERVGRSEIELAVLARTEVDRELPIAITLGVALPKGDRQRWLVEKAVELGVAHLVPLVTERSNHRESPAGLARLRRAVIEASKQCGRNQLMEIAEPQELAEYLSAPGHGEARLIAHPGGSSCAAVVESSTKGTKTPGGVRLSVGPEGGFGESEIATAQSSGWQLVDLGPRVLRVETAAVVLASAVMLRSQAS